MLVTGAVPTFVIDPEIENSSPGAGVLEGQSTVNFKPVRGSDGQYAKAVLLTASPWVLVPDAFRLWLMLHLLEGATT